MSDYKYEIQQIADDMALEEYSRDLYTLSPQARTRIYAHAEREWIDRQAAKAERLEDR